MQITTPGVLAKRLAKRLVAAWLSPINAGRVRHGYGYMRARYLMATQCPEIAKPLDVLFFCEQPSHWQNIKLVVEELLRRNSGLRLGVATSYSKLTSPNFISPVGVLSVSNVAFNLIQFFHARLLVTPYVGFPPTGRPLHADVVHALVSLTSLDGVYMPQHFDGYDYILCGGPHHLESFRAWARVQSTLSGKYLLPAGYPKLDLVLESQDKAKNQKLLSGQLAVVYAPTHIYDVNEQLASLRLHGVAIVNALLDAGHRVIFRPHPVSFSDKDRPLIDRICQSHANDANFFLDNSKDYTQSYGQADLMVTDVSGTGFTFSFSFGKPAIFFAPNTEAELGLQGIQFEARDRIGGVVRNIDQLLVRIIELAKRDMSEEIKDFRNETVFNVGNSSTYIVNCLMDILAGRERIEWIRL